ncbi:hypothetical protein EDB84DRAFT_611175 [Lactarius hengduanensis]|nr:hypothetical protein EDB84DRAFT_611175 [Lactarius hengduanensis]
MAPLRPSLVSNQSHSTSTMPKVPSTTTSSTDLETTFRSALEAYQKQTKKDIASHSLVGQLQSCDSPSAILDVLRAQFQALDKPQSADEKFTKWLDPTVHVLYAFSATLGNSVGLVFPPSNAVFAGIGVLLQAIKGVRASQNALVDLFSRLEYFFKRLEAYIKVRPTAAMTDIILDIIVKIMVEVLSILGIVTKEVRQGRTVRYLKELIGRKDVEDALQRLDKLTQEEARMAAAEALTITRGVDDKVKAVGERLEGVDKRVQSLDMKVEGVDEKVQSVDSKVQDIDRNVQGVDRNVQGVDRKVGSVIQRVKETGVVIQQMVNQVGHLNRS